MRTWSSGCRTLVTSAIIYRFSQGSAKNLGRTSLSGNDSSCEPTTIRGSLPPLTEGRRFRPSGRLLVEIWAASFIYGLISHVLEVDVGIQLMVTPVISPIILPAVPSAASALFFYHQTPPACMFPRGSMLPRRFRRAGTDGSFKYWQLVWRIRVDIVVFYCATVVRHCG